MKRAYIFDIDNTIADITHRAYLVSDKHKYWDEFLSRCPNDKPIIPVIIVLNTLFNSGYHIILFSGRELSIEQQTRQWLNKYAVSFDDLYMRNIKDFRHDSIIKQEWLYDVRRKYEILGAFDDRDSVVDMFRLNKIQCFQVAESTY